ncbi:MAG: hypothetical protein P4N41_07565 [Negativicutes bacterium]|nr:hypothetical protein [Negativicutes bacterium]
MPYWERPVYPPYDYHYAERPHQYAPAYYGYHYVDPPPKPASPPYVYTYPTYIPFNVNYGNPVIPSDIADLLEVAAVGNLSKFTVRYNESLEALGYHYQALRSGGRRNAWMCRQRCSQLYQRCLRFAVSDSQRRQCYDLYQRCLALCS